MQVCLALYVDEINYKVKKVLYYKHWARSWSWFRGSQPAGDISHKPDGRMLLLSTRPTVTVPAKEITPLVGNKYCLVTEACMCK